MHTLQLALTYATDAALGVGDARLTGLLVLGLVAATTIWTAWTWDGGRAR